MIHGLGAAQPPPSCYPVDEIEGCYANIDAGKFDSVTPLCNQYLADDAFAAQLEALPACESERPAWLLPAAIGGVVLLGAAVFYFAKK